LRASFLFSGGGSGGFGFGLGLSLGDLLGEGDFDDEFSAFDLLVVDRGERLLLVSLVFEFDKSESLASS